MKKTLSFLLAAAMLLGLIGCAAQKQAAPADHVAAAPKSTAIPTQEAELTDEAKEMASLLKDTTYLTLQEAEKIETYYEEAAKRKDSILDSPSTIVKGDAFIPGETYSGTAYYISPNGNDEDDGLSPETAWKNPLRCTWNPLSPGDAVFYERGGVYRFTEMSLRLASGVTYSAYGEGTKPVFTIARENSARTECWKLQSENNGVKIWEYYLDVPDVAGIVLNDESYAYRVLEWPTPDGWLAVDLLEMDPLNGITAKEDPCTNVQVASAGAYRTIEEGLTEDLTYISRVDITNISYPFEVEQAAPGKLYLRCDKGNPGECFSDIEMIYKNENDCGVVDAWNADGFVLDNISIKYYMDNAVSGNLLRKDALIQNCTVEWGGNRLFSIQSAEPTNNWCLIGDGIYGVAANATIRNNYMRHSGNGCTFESSMEMLENMGTYLVEGNVMENCGQGIRAYLINEEDTNRFEALILRDNIIIETGNGMNNACTEEPAAIDLGADKCSFAKKIEVYNNVLIGSALAIFRVPDPEYMNYDIHDNVVAQSRDGVLLTMGYGESSGIRWYTMEMVS